MRRMSIFELERMKDEHLRRMAEPEPYRTLRHQKERIEHEQEQARRRAVYDLQADQLRRDIRDMGFEPEA